MGHAFSEKKSGRIRSLGHLYWGEARKHNQGGAFIAARQGPWTLAKAGPFAKFESDVGAVSCAIHTILLT